jgi:hypothetical protein
VSDPSEIPLPATGSCRPFFEALADLHYALVQATMEVGVAAQQQTPALGPLVYKRKLVACNCKLCSRTRVRRMGHRLALTSMVREQERDRIAALPETPFKRYARGVIRALKDFGWAPLDIDTYDLVGAFEGLAQAKPDVLDALNREIDRAARSYGPLSEGDTIKIVYDSLMQNAPIPYADIINSRLPDIDVDEQPATRPACMSCQRELVPELDAYYGRDPAGSLLCSPCRRNLRVH